MQCQTGSSIIKRIKELHILTWEYNRKIVGGTKRWLHRGQVFDLLLIILPCEKTICTSNTSFQNSCKFPGTIKQQQSVSILQIERKCSSEILVSYKLQIITSHKTKASLITAMRTSNLILTQRKHKNSVCLWHPFSASVLLHPEVNIQVCSKRRYMTLDLRTILHTLTNYSFKVATITHT
jgi:hypothetical protein